jgi:hypothetical protein
MIGHTKNRSAGSPRKSAKNARALFVLRMTAVTKKQVISGRRRKCL